MASKLELKVVEHKNNLGQTIQPGDEVVIVTTGYNHRVSIKKGVYLGKKNDGVSCRVTESHTKYRHKETGEDVGYWWGNDAKERGTLPEYPKHPGYPTAVRYNDPGYNEYRAKVQEIAAAHQEVVNAYQEKTREVGQNYEAFKVPYFRHTTLQLNRIYKLDTSVFDLEV